MAMVVDQQPTFKHFCRICKKGFGCGRALGGHMRAHGIGDENLNIDDDDDTSNDWDDHHHKVHDGDNHPPSNKRMYALRTNPNRLKSCRICENCGMEFLSWKSFLEHGKCNSSVGGYIDTGDHVTPPESDYEDGSGVARTWSKGIRSRRAKLGINSNFMNSPLTEEEDLANCLVLLSSARVDHPIWVAETEESSAASASKEDIKGRKPINFFMPENDDHQLLIQGENNINKAKGTAGGTKGLFECKACKKVFNSHQALGGHRASHKKVKGCYAAKHEIHDNESILMDDDATSHDEFLNSSSKSMAINLSFDNEGNITNLRRTTKRKSKVHECSICHRIFSSGQALGGHKRCHWVTSTSPDNTSTSIAFHQFKDQNPKFDQRSSSSHLNKQFDVQQSSVLDLNLNLPAPCNEVAARLAHQKINLNENKLLGFEVPWIGLSTNNNDAIDDKNLKNSNDTKMVNYSKVNEDQDEEYSNVKVAKLSDLKDMKMGDGSSSPWLQVGIGSSTSNVGSDP